MCHTFGTLNKTVLTKKKLINVLLVSLILGFCLWFYAGNKPPYPWTADEIKIIETLHIDSLPLVPKDTSNSISENPLAAKLGHSLFFDTRLSANGKVSCATCHQPDNFFTDKKTKGMGIGSSRLNTRSIVGSAYSPWLYSNGRKDSLWSQALSPLEDPNEHASNRVQIAKLLTNDSYYRSTYESVFGPLPDLSNPERYPAKAAPLPGKLGTAWQSMSEQDRGLITEIFVNTGKAIAAYERLLVPGPSRFDSYVKAVSENNLKIQEQSFSNSEIRGLRLFISKASCIDCHNGPLFTNNEFHNTGVISSPTDTPDKGRIDGIRIVKTDIFNCMGVYSDDLNQNCEELQYARYNMPELLGAIRTPSLRNIKSSAPYMHSGQIETLAEVIQHYNLAPLSMIGHNEAEPLNLSLFERRDLLAFLKTLEAPLSTHQNWLISPITNPKNSL